MVETRHIRIHTIRTSSLLIAITAFLLSSLSCEKQADQSEQIADGTIRLIQLNPGHFHAGLVQKSMYDLVDPVVHVYAPEGPDLDDFLARIDGFNTRAEQPTTWHMRVYSGPDYLEKMLVERAGNVLVTAGNNAQKTDYIKRAVEAELNVLADKPMVIHPDEFPLLIEAFRAADENRVLLYDIMTERYEITNILQRELSMISAVFGELENGSAEEPAITKESVHHLFKYVSGSPLVRPGWFFDVEQQGTGLADVGTHLVDLIQWECFPGQVVDYESDIEIITADGWATDMDQEQFEQVTGLSKYPDYLSDYIDRDVLHYHCNGGITYTIKGVYARVSVIWNFQAPEGTGDTHYSIMRGSKCNLIIRQGREEEYRPTLYIEARGNTDAFAESLGTAVTELITVKYPGIELIRLSQERWKVGIPEEYKVGHETHFSQVMEKYLQFLAGGEMPAWEVPNMITKYYTTTTAARMITNR